MIPTLETLDIPQKVEPEKVVLELIDTIEVGNKTLYYYNNMKEWDNANRTEKLLFEYFLREENI